MQQGIAYEDFGCHNTEASCDYPDMAAARLQGGVTSGDCTKALLFCGTGIGISMAANKAQGHPGSLLLRLLQRPRTPALHNDANALCMGGRVVGAGLAVPDWWTNSWHASFEGGRHQRRVDKLTALERVSSVLRKAIFDLLHDKPISRGVFYMAITPFIADHPLIQHKLTLLRDKNTGVQGVPGADRRDRHAACATRPPGICPLKEVEIETPMCHCQDPGDLPAAKLAFVPILRAGLGMVDGVLQLVPAAKVGHIGLYRDPETLEPVEYYCKLPADIAERDVIVLDPMLATGGSAIDAINQIKKPTASRTSSSCASSPLPRACKRLQRGPPRCADLLRCAG